MALRWPDLSKGCVLAGLVLALGAKGLCEPVSYGQALSKEKQGDWQGAVEAYQAVIADLLAAHPDSILLPKSYMGCAYSALKLGDTDLGLQCLLDLWSTGAWANPGLPASPEFVGYQDLLAGQYADAIRSFETLSSQLPLGSKRWQEARIAVAACHLMIGTRGHSTLAWLILQDLSAQLGDKDLRAFAEWMNGVRFLALMDVGSAEQSFLLAQTYSPLFDPSQTLESIVKDQLQPPVDIDSCIGQSGADLAQLLEDYVRAWYLTLKAQSLEASGDSAGAEALYREAEGMWSQLNVSSTGFMGL